MPTTSDATIVETSLDQLYLNDNNPTVSQDFKEKVTLYNIGDDDEEKGSSRSRKFTPNPWDIYHRRQKLK